MRAETERRHFRFLRKVLMQELNSPSALHKAILTASEELMRGTVRRFWLYNPDAHEFTVQACQPPVDSLLTSIPEEGTFSGDAIAQSKPLYYPNVLREKKLVNRRAAKQMNLRALWILPIFLQSESSHLPYGTLAIYPEDDDYNFSDQDVNFLMGLTNIIDRHSPALDRQTLTGTLELGRSPEESFPEFWQRVAQAVAKELGFETCTIFVMSHTGDRIRRISGVGYSIEREAPAAVLPSGGVEYRRGYSATGYALREARTVFSQDVHSEEWCAGPFKGPRAGKGVTFLASPIFGAHIEGPIGLVRCTDKYRLVDPPGRERISQSDITRIEALTRELGPIMQHYLHAEQNRVLWALASHDLRAQLNVIRDAAGMTIKRNQRMEAISGFPLSERAKKDLLGIIDNAALMHLQVDVVAAGAEEEIAYDFSKVALVGEGLAKVVGLLRGKAATRNVRLQRADFSRFPRLWHDPLRVQIVFYNLLINAIKYSFRDTDTRISWRARGGSYFIEVANYGIGVRVGEKGRLFSPFERSPRAERLATGKGLGLFISRRIMRAHGGDVELIRRARPTIFALRFPKDLENAKPATTRSDLG